MAQVVASYTNPGASGSFTIQGNYNWKYGQTFTVPMFCRPRSVAFTVRRTGSPAATSDVRIHGVVGGYGTNSTTIDALNVYWFSNQIDETTFPTSYGTVTFTSSDETILSPYSQYAAIMNLKSKSVNDYVSVRNDNDSPTHDGTVIGTMTLGSSTLTSDTGIDAPFTIYADPLPMPQYTTNVSSGSAPLSVTFTDTSLYTPTSWSWDFGDGTTSTSQNPTHVYSNPGRYTVKLTASNAYGGVMRTDAQAINVSTVVTPNSLGDLALTLNQPTVIQTAPPPPPDTDWSALGKEDEKVYVYKVYKSDGTYIGIWSDVNDDLQYSQRLNTPGTTTTVRLSRSPNTKKEVRDVRITEAGDVRITEDGLDTRTAAYETANTVGSGSDVDLNYNVDVFVHYGEFAERITESGDVRITEDGDTRIATVGAPLGVRIFSGYIMDYESVYGSDEGVTVTLASHGIELSNEVIRSGTTTTVTYSSTALETVAKSILDTNPGKVTYDTNSIGITGVSETLTYRLNTKLEGIETLYAQTPDGWYWYGNVAENLLYLRPVSSTYDHVFMIGQHIKELRVKRTIEGLINILYFVGGETTPGDGTTTLYKKYEDTTSQTTWRKGLERITDRRYKLATSMQRRADKLLGRYKNPVYTSPLTISSAKYDIESIKLGQTVGFRNFGNFIDGLPPLQVVSLQYSPSAVIIELGELQRTQADILDDAEQSIANEAYDAIPNAPS